MRLSDLPEELVSNISLRLGCDDVCSLRLCSRALESKTLHEFAKEHFSSKAVHFTTDSLKVVVGIAQSEKLSKYLKEIYVLTAMFSERAFGCPGDGISHWRPTVRQSEAYRFYMEDQAKLKKTKGDEALLAEAFRSLPSLTKVALLDTETLLKPGTDYRGQFKTIRITGTRPFLAPMTAHDRGVLIDRKDNRAWLAHMWSALLHAMAAASDTLRLEDFTTDFSSARYSIRPKQLDLGETTLTQLKKVFQKTTRLQMQMTPMPTAQENKKYRDHIQPFAALFINVSELSLSFEFNPSTAPLYRRFMGKFDTSNLTDLSLRETCTEGAALCKLITRTPKLKELKLDGLDLTSGDWPPVLKAISKLKDLEHLHLMYLREAGNKAYFLKQLDPEEEEDLTPGNAFAHMMGDNWDDDDDDDDDTDDELPDPEPAAGSAPSASPSHGPTLPSLGSAVDFGTAPTHAPTTVSTPAVHPIFASVPTPSQAAAAAAENEPMSDYVPNGTAADYGERGFYICISGHTKIVRELQIFMKEYNLGEPLDEEGHGGLFAGLGGLAGFGAIPVTLPMGNPPPGGAGGPGAALANLFGGAMPTNAQLNNLFGGMGAHHHHHVPPAPGATAGGPPPGTFGPPPPPQMANSHAQAGPGAAAPAATANDEDGWTSDDDELPDLEDDLGGVAVA